MAGPVQVRRLMLADGTACAAIERRSLAPDLGWSIADFASFLEYPCHGGYVAIWQGRAVGYLLYQADRPRRCLYLTRLVVIPSWRRRHVGSLLVEHVRCWLRPVPDVRLQALVHERQLSLQCFLRANGLLATRISRGWFDDGTNDGYLFELVAEPARRPEQAREGCS